jgi:carbonic anhydrase/acetyltransferase-like protein (isoleucine patch superfamily)
LVIRGDGGSKFALEILARAEFDALGWLDLDAFACFGIHAKAAFAMDDLERAEADQLHGFAFFEVRFDAHDDGVDGTLRVGLRAAEFFLDGFDKSDFVHGADLRFAGFGSSGNEGGFSPMGWKLSIAIAPAGEFPAGFWFDSRAGRGTVDKMRKPIFGVTDQFVQTIRRNIRTAPRIAPDAYIADDATVAANAEVGPEASVWHQAVLRGDVAPVVLGAQSNVQDGAVVHTADNLPAIIGQLVTVGHKAIVHACTVEDEVLVGMGAVILDGARVGTRSIIGANATVKQGMEIPPGSLVLGTPAKIVRVLSGVEQDEIKMWALRYVRLSREYLKLRG